MCTYIFINNISYLYNCKQYTIILNFIKYYNIQYNIYYNNIHFKSVLYITIYNIYYLQIYIIIK